MCSGSGNVALLGMEVIVKLGKTNTMTNTWGKTKTKRTSGE